MATIVVHGTMTTSAAKNSTWWWNSWHDSGFLGALAGGMSEASSWHDVWRVNGVAVSNIPELTQTKWSALKGRSGLAQYRGHFTWSGANMFLSRDVGATQFAEYLNAIRSLTNEEICVVAHSHGCNVVKAALSHRSLSAQVSISKLVFLACPHFQSHDGSLRYRIPPPKVGQILNLYTQQDPVQTSYAQSLTGPAAKLADFLPQESHRTDPDPAVHHLYRNFEVPCSASGVKAHSVMHGALIGGLCGMWLNSNETFPTIVSRYPDLPAIPSNDTGE